MSICPNCGSSLPCTCACSSGTIRIIYDDVDEREIERNMKNAEKAEKQNNLDTARRYYQNVINEIGEDKDYESLKKEVKQAIKNINKAQIFSNEAQTLYDQYKDEEALTLINVALSYSQNNSNDWNRKAIILEGLERYEESNDCYEKSLRLDKSDIVIENRAIMKKNWSIKLSEEKNYEKALKLINEAIEELSKIETEEDIETYESCKRMIISKRDFSRKCGEQERLLKEIGKEKLITIAGTYYYIGEFKKVNIGSLLRLVKEPENEHDPNAIAVYYNDKKVGYVANSDYTASDLTSKAHDIQYIGENTCAEYLMEYGYYPIAKINDIISEQGGK